MVATPAIAHNSSSKKLIEGCPAPLAYYGDLMINLETYLNDIIEECRKEEVSRIQAVLPQKDKGWEDIAEDGQEFKMPDVINNFYNTRS